MRSSVPWRVSLASDHAHPETHQTHESPAVEAFAELSRLVQRLGEELAGYRKRALTAESRVRALEEEAARAGDIAPGRALALEQRNQELERRLGEAEARTERMLARVRFLRQQRESGAGGAA